MNIKRLDIGQTPMQLKESNSVSTLHFPELLNIPWLIHGISTRFGGVSKDIYSSMNFKEDAEDFIENVRENYRRIASALGCDVNKIVRPSLVHEAVVHKVNKEDYGTGCVRASDLKQIDALITNDIGVTLAATFADCVPLFFIDQKHHAIGLAHSGWRGTVKRIGRETLLAMREAYHTQLDDVIVAIGCCICKDCYEVGEEVYHEFCQEFPCNTENLSIIKTNDIAEKNAHGRYQLDLRKANQRILIEAGLNQNQIYISDICTCCNPNLLFSHRATKGRRGAIGAFLGISENLLESSCEKI